VKRNFKAAARTVIVPPFRSFKTENATACFGKQRHSYSREYVPQRVDLGLDRKYEGKQVPDDLVFEICTNVDNNGKQCAFRVCVNMVEAF
jgi:hypothetical protein